MEWQMQCSRMQWETAAGRRLFYRIRLSRRTAQTSERQYLFEAIVFGCDSISAVFFPLNDLWQVHPRACLNTELL